MIYQIKTEKLPQLLERLAAAQELCLPVEHKGQVDFASWTPKAKVRLDVCNTARSAKDFFFPQGERLVSFRMEGRQIQVEAPQMEEKPFVIFGARPCDVRSFQLLDRVFLSDPVDRYYENRRRRATIVTAACLEPEETCFCGNFGIDPVRPQLGDVVIWTAGDTLYWESLTDKGEALTAQGGELLEALSEEPEALTQAQDGARAIHERLPFGHLNLQAISSRDWREVFEDPIWEKLSKSCLGCGSCTYVCPTCQCYDIRDFDTGHGVERYRCWDSCMYSSFTQMAHGNPRTTQKERFRQRFMHKLVYFPQNEEGLFSCVGCGRCLNKCPVSTHMVKVIQELGGKQDV